MSNTHDRSKDIRRKAFSLFSISFGFARKFILDVFLNHSMYDKHPKVRPSFLIRVINVDVLPNDSLFLSFVIMLVVMKKFIFWATEYKSHSFYQTLKNKGRGPRLFLDNISKMAIPLHLIRLIFTYPNTVILRAQMTRKMMNIHNEWE